jgi:hypothetical protein
LVFLQKLCAATFPARGNKTRTRVAKSNFDQHPPSPTTAPPSTRGRPPRAARLLLLFPLLFCTAFVSSSLFFHPTAQKTKNKSQKKNYRLV